MMFDHVKCLKDWTRMACCVYDGKYRKVLAIACDMQFEDCAIQIIFWNFF